MSDRSPYGATTTEQCWSSPAGFSSPIITLTPSPPSDSGGTTRSVARWSTSVTMSSRPRWSWRNSGCPSIPATPSTRTAASRADSSLRMPVSVSISRCSVASSTAGSRRNSSPCAPTRARWRRAARTLNSACSKGPSSGTSCLSTRASRSTTTSSARISLRPISSRCLTRSSRERGGETSASSPSDRASSAAARSAHSSSSGAAW